MVAEEQTVTDGAAPDLDTIEKIKKWAHENIEDNIYLSRSFLKDHGKELGLNERAAGVVIYFMERNKNNILIWFRKEFDEHINWAGNPEKKLKWYRIKGKKK